MHQYRESPERQGFWADDTPGIGDWLIDTLVAWGSPRHVLDQGARLQAAGAGHVRLTVLDAEGRPTGAAAARLLAAEFG